MRNCSVLGLADFLLLGTDCLRQECGGSHIPYIQVRYTGVLICVVMLSLAALGRSTFGCWSAVGTSVVAFTPHSEL